MMRWRVAAALAMLAPAGSAAACPPRQGPFRVYQALLYRGMPDLRLRGIAPVHVIDRGFWDDDVHKGAVVRSKIAPLLAALPDDGAPIVLDIERPDLHRSDPTFGAAVRMLAQTAAWFKAAAPARTVGYYGLFPLADYWRTIDVPPGGRRDWQADNDAARAIGAHVDAVYPSLYTFYRDRAGWVAEATAMVCEARRISGKPVYAFIWPEFHDSTADAGRELPGDYWQLELETLHGIADGVVIWGGYQRPWNERSPWWQVTQAMIRRWVRAPGP